MSRLLTIALVLAALGAAAGLAYWLRAQDPDFDVLVG
jgi:hypothetical protein